MISSNQNSKANKNCVICGNRVRDNCYVLSDQSYIHKPCLDIIRVSILDNGIDEDMRQFYDFLLSKVVRCNKCNNPLDLIHKNYITAPLCSACKPNNIFEAKNQIEFCELCDHQITKQNKLKKVPLIQGIIMCATCYKEQTGEQDPELQQKPDFREYKPAIKQKKQFKQINMFAKLTNFKNVQEVGEKKIKIQKIQQPFLLPKMEKLIECVVCQKKFDQSHLLNSSDNIGLCQGCFGLKDLFEGNQKLQIEQIKCKIEPGDQYQEFYGLQQLFAQKNQKKKLQKTFSFEKVVAQKVQTKQKVETVKLLNEEKHNYLLKECKICFNAQSQMLNVQCRHLMMCQPCYKALLKRQHKKHEMCCPVCQTVGKYYKYLQPIYI